MADVSFQGPEKLIIVNNGVTYLSVKDVYSAWKVWTSQGGNSKYLQAISYIGADPLPAGQLGTTFFLENGWKIRPYEGNHTLTIVGNLYARDGSDPFVSTLGTWNIRVISVVSTLVEVVTENGIGTPQEVRDAVWGADISSYPSGTAGSKLNDQINGLTPAQSTMLLELYNIMGLDPTKPLLVTNTSRVAGDIVQTIDTNTTSTTVQRQ
jgi:hypothetical protein